MVKVEELEPVTASDRGVATDGVILVGNPNDDDDVESFSGVGLVTNSILFCWLFITKDQRKIVRFHEYTINVCADYFRQCLGIFASNVANRMVSFIRLKFRNRPTGQG